MGLKAGAGFFTFIQMNSEELLIADVQSALDFIMTIKFETDCTNIAINREAIVEDFFVLSTCLAGEILQKFVNYGVRFAVYGDFSNYTSKSLKEEIFIFSLTFLWQWISFQPE